MHVIAACRVKNTCAPEHATYSIGLGREGIDLAIDRSIRRSWIRCCRRPGPDLLVVQHGVDHTRCVASLTSPLYHSFPYPSPPSILPLPPSPFSPFSPAGFQPSLSLVLPREDPDSHFDSSSSLLSFLPFATTTYRPIFFSFFLSFSSFFLSPFCFVHACPKEGEVKSKKKGERRANKILDIIVGRVVSFFFFFFFFFSSRPMQLCSSLSYTSFDFAGRSSTSPSMVLFPLLLFVVLLVEEARKNAPRPPLPSYESLAGDVIYTNPCVFFSPFFHLLIMISQGRNLDLERSVDRQLREIELGSSDPLTHSSACRFSRVLIDSANYSLEHPTPFRSVWIFRMELLFSDNASDLGTPSYRIF